MLHISVMKNKIKRFGEESFQVYFIKKKNKYNYDQQILITFIYVVKHIKKNQCKKKRFICRLIYYSMNY